MWGLSPLLKAGSRHMTLKVSVPLKRKKIHISINNIYYKINTYTHTFDKILQSFRLLRTVSFISDTLMKEHNVLMKGNVFTCK